MCAGSEPEKNCDAQVVRVNNKEPWKRRCVRTGWEAFIEINGLIINPWREGRWRWMGGMGVRGCYDDPSGVISSLLWFTVNMCETAQQTRRAASHMHMHSPCGSVSGWITGIVVTPTQDDIVWKHSSLFSSPLMLSLNPHRPSLTLIFRAEEAHNKKEIHFNWQVPDTLWPGFVQWVIHEGPTWLGFQ